MLHISPDVLSGIIKVLDNQELLQLIRMSDRKLVIEGRVASGLLYL